MNKEGLAADLVCMLGERLLPRDSAKLQEQIERFFIAGASRIDLISKVIDLDNDIGGHNFDIRNLEETSNAIKSLAESGGKHHCFILSVNITEANHKLAGTHLTMIHTYIHTYMHTNDLYSRPEKAFQRIHAKE